LLLIRDANVLPRASALMRAGDSGQWRSWKRFVLRKGNRC